MSKKNPGLCNNKEEKNEIVCNKRTQADTHQKKVSVITDTSCFSIRTFRLRCGMDRNFPGIFHYLVNVSGKVLSMRRIVLYRNFHMPITGNRSRWNALNKQKAKYVRRISTKLKFIVRYNIAATKIVNFHYILMTEFIISKHIYLEFYPSLYIMAKIQKHFLTMYFLL